jgi:hypothetical protein
MEEKRVRAGENPIAVPPVKSGEYYEKVARERDPRVVEITDLCRKDLRFLSMQFLGYKDWDGVHDDVEKLLRKPSKKKALLLPRGHLKSTLVTVAYTIQTLSLIHI